MSLFDPIDDMFGVGQNPGREAQLQAIHQIAGVNTPSIDQLKYQLQNMIYQGDITPEQANAILQNPSAMQGIDVTTGRSAQLQALNQLQEIESGGGMTAGDQADLNAVMGRTASAARGSREAIMQGARQRGISGGGMELAAQLQNDQNAATQGNQQGLDVAKMAQQRALEAMVQSGQLGGQIQGQEFGEQAQKAGAQDAISRFNAQNSQSVINANVAAKNAFVDRNAQERQRIADSNTGLANEKSRADANAVQQAFQNNMTKANAMSNGYNNMATGQNEAQKQKLAFEGGLLQTGGTVAGGYLSGRNNPYSDKNKKTDIKDASGFDLDAFMASIDPKTFKYKEPGTPGQAPGENVGVLAQDVEKTPVGRTMVKNTPGGKQLDMQKGFGVILAALASLHDRLEGEEPENV